MVYCTFCFPAGPHASSTTPNFIVLKMSMMILQQDSKVSLVLDLYRAKLPFVNCNGLKDVESLPRSRGTVYIQCLLRMHMVPRLLVIAVW